MMRWATRIAVTVGLLALIVLAGLAWLGYFARDPFTNYSASQHRQTGMAAFLLSGDMGMKVGMGPEVAASLAASGIPVVGLNSMTYFRTARSPAETAGMIADGINRARKLGQTNSIILIGQSFGADMLHVGLAQLSPVQRKYVRMAILVVPTAPIYRQVSLGEVSGVSVPDGSAMATASRLTWTPVLCTYGAEESDSTCPNLTMPNVRRVALPGGHRLRFDPAPLLAAIHGFIPAAIGRTD